MMKEECAGAVTSVFWNMDTCPIPPGFDGRLVGPCFKRYLEKLGYSGPLTMCAFGTLTDVPGEVLRAVSSSGILLNIDTFGSNSLPAYVFRWINNNPTPANIMVITHSTDSDTCGDLFIAEEIGYNIIRPYPFGPTAECLWTSFLLTESGALEEDYCIEMGESAWVCQVCHGVTGQGIENFTTHISSQEHAHEKSRWFPPAAAEEDEEDEEDEEARVEPSWRPSPSPSFGYVMHQPNATPMAMHQPKPWDCLPQHPHMFATPSHCSRCCAMTQPKPRDCLPQHPHMFATPSHCSRCCAMTQPKACCCAMTQPKPWDCLPQHPHMFATPSQSHGKDEPEPSAQALDDVKKKTKKKARKKAMKKAMKKQESDEQLKMEMCKLKL